MSNLRISSNYQHFTEFNPDVQFLQMSILFLSVKTFFLNESYLLPLQIFLKESVVRSPIKYFASLSKQQGNTLPSQVITGFKYNRMHLFGNELFIK